MNWWLKKLVQGLTCRDWVFVLRLEELRQNIYLVESLPSGPSAYHPTSSSELPWFVVLLLGAFSKKHIFVPKKTSASVIRARLEDFENRLKWATHFRNEQCSKYQKPLVPRRVWECKKVPPAVVPAFCREVTKVVRQKLDAIQVCPRLPAFVAAAKKWLKQNGLCCVPSDKDGVFALTSRSLLNKLIYNELSKPCYAAYSPLSLEGDCTALKLHLLSAARAADRLSDSWGSQIRSSVASVKESSLLDSLLATIKTHKEPISVRLIHSSTGNCLNALGEAVNRILAPKVASVWHVCASSEDVVAKIRGIETSARTLLIK